MKGKIKTNKILTLILALAMLVPNFTALASQTEPIASQDTSQKADFDFDDETGTIKKYLGDEIEVVIPDSIDGVPVKEIGKDAFFKSKVENVTLPKDLEKIGRRAFAASSLKSIEIPDKVEFIDDYAFQVCQNLQSIEIPGSVKTIGARVFMKCENLEEIVLNEGIEIIGQGSFALCSKLRGEIIIPSSVKYVVTSAFNKTGVDTLTIKAGSNDEINLKSNLGNNLTNINIESFEKPAKIHFNTASVAEGSVLNVNLPSLNGDFSNIDELEAWLNNNLKVQIGGSHVNKSDTSGLNDIFQAFPLKWDFSQFADQGEFEIKGVIDKENTKVESHEGYTPPSILDVNNEVNIRIKVNNNRQS